MNRLVLVGAACTLLGYAAGATFTRGDAIAQTPALSARRPPEPALAPDQPAKAIYWSIDDLRKTHLELVKRAAAGKGTNGVYDLMPMPFTRTHAMKLNHRPRGLNAGAEQHYGVTDFYVVLGGGASVTVGGMIENRTQSAGLPGEFRGPAITGGETYRLKAGDWMMIPPGTPHLQVPDQDGFSYMMMKINVGLYPWSLVAGMNTPTQ
jgi:mannose-6-phosphate isomerase-like protein (cupin superfamily)